MDFKQGDEIAITGPEATHLIGFVATVIKTDFTEAYKDYPDNGVTMLVKIRDKPRSNLTNIDRREIGKDIWFRPSNLKKYEI